jgi:hypothetical protein
MHSILPQMHVCELPAPVPPTQRLPELRDRLLKSGVTVCHEADSDEGARQFFAMRNVSFWPKADSVLIRLNIRCWLQRDIWVQYRTTANWNA